MPNFKKNTPAPPTTAKGVPYVRPKGADIPASERMEMLGFKKVPRPDGDMPVMKTISGFSYIELSDLQVTFARWREYTQDLMMEVLKEIADATDAYSRAYGKALYTVTGAKNVTEKKLLAENTPEVLDARKVLADAEEIRDALEIQQQKFNDCLAVLSREITLRNTK